MAHVQAPWTDRQVAALQAWQTAPGAHPFFKCQRAVRDDHINETPLVATPAGWVCPRCDYTQDWAHDFMFEPAPGPGGPVLGNPGANGPSSPSATGRPDRDHPHAHRHTMTLTRAELVAELRAKVPGRTDTIRHVRPALLRDAADILEADGRWRAEATLVLSQWDEAWDKAGRPGHLGQSKSDGMLDAFNALRALIREVVEWPRALDAVGADLATRLQEATA